MEKTNNLTVAEEISTIFKVWGEQEGWVRIPRKLRDSSAPKGPKNHAGKWEEKLFKWPDDRLNINNWIKESVLNRYDLYWCPSVFTKPRGIKENIPELRYLYADLDELDPTKLPKELKPTICWSSSPGRYAALWALSKPVDSKQGEQLNKRLSYYIGADRGGWDLTQVLRVPGLRNHKYEGSPQGHLLWYHNNKIPVETFTKLPTVDELEELPPIIEEITDSSIDSLPSLIRPHLQKLKPKLLQLLFTPEDEVFLDDRSERLWEIECRLLEAGVPQEDVVKIVACSAWNKYKGRKDETHRIVTEVAKAAQTVKPQFIQNDYRDKRWASYSNLLGQNLSQPGWMIEGWWQKTSHGMISGEPKTYKSVIVTDMAVSVASGRPFLGHFAVHHQGPVLYVQEENAPWLVQDRVIKIAASKGLMNGEVTVLSPTRFKIRWPQNLPIYFLNQNHFDFTNPEDQEFLEESLREIKPVLIIFDPLYLMMGEADENSSKDIRPILNWLLHIRYTYNTSVIVLHHWNKSGRSERGGQRMLGSVLFHGWVESAAYTSVVDEENHVISVDREFRSFSKPNKLDIKFVFGEPGEAFYEPQIAQYDFTDGNEDPVCALLKGSTGMTETEIAKTLSISRQQLKIRIKELIKKDKLVMTKDGNTIKIKLKGGDISGEL